MEKNKRMEIYPFRFRLCHCEISVLIPSENHSCLKGCGWQRASLRRSLANCNSMSMRQIIWPALAWALPGGKAWKQSELARGCTTPNPLMPTSSVINNTISAKVDSAEDNGNAFPKLFTNKLSWFVRIQLRYQGTQHLVWGYEFCFVDVHLTASRERMPACSSLPRAVDKVFMSSSRTNSNLVTPPVLPSAYVFNTTLWVLALALAALVCREEMLDKLKCVLSNTLNLGGPWCHLPKASHYGAKPDEKL